MKIIIITILLIESKTLQIDSDGNREICELMSSWAEIELIRVNGFRNESNYNLNLIGSDAIQIQRKIITPCVLVVISERIE